MARARSAESYLTHLLDGVFKQLQTVRILKRQTAKIAISPEDNELEQKVFWVFNGYKALREQIELLQQRSDELKVQLAGDVFTRLMEKDPSITPFKKKTSI